MLTTTVTALRTMLSPSRIQADSMNSEGFEVQLAKAAQERQLCDQIAIWVATERTRLQMINEFDRSCPRQTPVQLPRKSELTRAYVIRGGRVLPRGAESWVWNMLGLATRARQGPQLHKADFRDARSGTKLTGGPSEGEQTWWFFTEAHFDASVSTDLR